MPVQKITIEQVVGAATNEFSTLHRSIDTFDDLLHAVINSTRRATSEEDVQNLCHLFHKLFFLCDNDDDGSNNRWKLLLLSLVYKRYHSKAPEAKEIKEENDNDNHVAGQGERLIFYTAIACLHRYEIQNNNGNDKDKSRNALNCLARVAPLSGGSRDVCAIIEIGVYSILSPFIAQQKSLAPSALVAEALKIVVSDLERASFLHRMLEVAANALDHDMELIQKDKNTEKEKNEKVKKELPSTFNVYIPHHGRGKVSNNKKRSRNGQPKMSNRNLVQSIAEILIWSRTTVAMSNGAFSSAYEGILQSASDKPWHRLQTVVRNIRKQLNQYSRDEGFMLGNQFTLDATCITPAMIGKAKAGDLSELTRLAKKKEATRVLKLINLRYAMDPSKVSPYESIGELIRSWVSLDDDNEAVAEDIVEEDSIRELELDIQRSKINATIQKLRSKRKKNPQSDESSAVIASLDSSIPNMVSAVLIAASMNDWPEDKEAVSEHTEMDIAAGQEDESTDKFKQVLYLGESSANVTSYETTMNLLNSIITGKHSASSEAPSFSNAGIATTKAVMNLIDRHVEDSNVLMLFSSANLQLPNDRMENLTQRGCALHCHDADVFGARLQREGAGSGDITISLAWDTIDDLDLHVVLPSGEELSYENERSQCGLGMLDVDMNAGGPYSKEPVENVFIGKPDELIQAPKGKYQVIVQNYSYNSKESRGKPIPWRVLVDKNGEKTQYNGECKGTGNSSNVVACEFNYDGRTVPFPKKEELSAFCTSNLVNITASTGETFESLIQLMDTRKDIDELNRVRELAIDEGSNDNRPLVAATDQLEVTSRDRLYMQLCKLPSRFHHMVEEALGGGITLAEKCARDVARLMLKDNLHVSKLEQSGYPEDIVAHIKSIMQKGSVPAT